MWVTEEKKLTGHLRITRRPDSEPYERLRIQDLKYEWDGKEIERLAYLKLEFDPKNNAVVNAEMKVYVTDVEIDVDALEVLRKAETYVPDTNKPVSDAAR